MFFDCSRAHLEGLGNGDLHVVVCREHAERMGDARRLLHVLRRCPQHSDLGGEVTLKTFALEAASERRDKYVGVALLVEGAVAGEPQARQHFEA